MFIYFIMQFLWRGQLIKIFCQPCKLAHSFIFYFSLVPRSTPPPPHFSPASLGWLTATIDHQNANHSLSRDILSSEFFWNPSLLLVLFRFHKLIVKVTKVCFVSTLAWADQNNLPYFSAIVLIATLTRGNILLTVFLWAKLWIVMRSESCFYVILDKITAIIFFIYFPWIHVTIISNSSPDVLNTLKRWYISRSLLKMFFAF